MMDEQSCSSASTVSDGELIVSFNQLNSETGCCPNDSSKLTYNFKGLPSVAPFLPSVV
jgi:hypothetical protein